MCTNIFPINSAGIEQHYFVTDDWEIMINLEVIELVTFWKNVLKQRPKPGNVPLSVSKVIDEIPCSFIRCHFEGVIEATVGLEYLQVYI